MALLRARGARNDPKDEGESAGFGDTVAVPRGPFAVVHAPRSASDRIDTQAQDDASPPEKGRVSFVSSLLGGYIRGDPLARMF